MLSDGKITDFFCTADDFCKFSTPILRYRLCVVEDKCIFSNIL